MSQEEFDMLLNDRHGRYAQLKKLIVSMDLIPALSKSSFDSLTEKTMQQLEKGIDLEKLKKIMEYELCVTYGLYTDEFDSEEIATDIMNWWQHHQ